MNWRDLSGCKKSDRRFKNCASTWYLQKENLTQLHVSLWKKRSYIRVLVRYSYRVNKEGKKKRTSVLDRIGSDRTDNIVHHWEGSLFTREVKNHLKKNRLLYKNLTTSTKYPTLGPLYSHSTDTDRVLVPGTVCNKIEIPAIHLYSYSTEYWDSVQILYQKWRGDRERVCVKGYIFTYKYTYIYKWEKERYRRSGGTLEYRFI